MCVFVSVLKKEQKLSEFDDLNDLRDSDPARGVSGNAGESLPNFAQIAGLRHLKHSQGAGAVDVNYKSASSLATEVTVAGANCSSGNGSNDGQTDGCDGSNSNTDDSTTTTRRGSAMSQSPSTENFNYGDS